MTDPVPASAGSSDASLADYIRANRDRFTREALTEALTRDGHSGDAITEAWRQADADETSGQPAPSEGPTRLRQSLLTLFAVLLALGAFLLGEVALLAASHGRPLMFLYAVLFPIQIAYVTGWIVRRIGSSGGLRRGNAAVTLGWLVVPVVVLVALMGICAGYGATFGCVIECS